MSVAILLVGLGAVLYGLVVLMVAARNIRKDLKIVYNETKRINENLTMLIEDVSKDVITVRDYKEAVQDKDNLVRAIAQNHPGVLAYALQLGLKVEAEGKSKANSPSIG